MDFFASCLTTEQCQAELGVLVPKTPAGAVLFSSPEAPFHLKLPHENFLASFPTKIFLLTELGLPHKKILAS
jgi:hypothetical protein